LIRRDDDLIGDPPCDVGGVGGWECQDDVPEVGVERFADGLSGGFGAVVGDRQDERTGDRGGVAVDLGAEAVQQCATPEGGVDVVTGEVPDVGVLGDYA
jgi:hypothetical protein